MLWYTNALTDASSFSFPSSYSSDEGPEAQSHTVGRAEAGLQVWCVLNSIL